jgi:hypothetical protein
MKRLSIILLFCLNWNLQAESILKLVLDGNDQISRSELAYLKPKGDERGVLILCPGVNGDGSKFLNTEWAKWALEKQLGVIGLSFASDISEIHEKGYYYMDSGSGNLLLEGIKKIYGTELPLYLYGISGGAHFVSRFVEWRPQGVQAWCAYSAGWWTPPHPSELTPKGIIACGRNDPRYLATREYFNAGRDLGKPWLFISLKDVGHYNFEPLNRFVREYFEAILLKKKNDQWIRLSLEECVNTLTGFPPAYFGYLPSKDLLKNWQQLHFQYILKTVQ